MSDLRELLETAAGEPAVPTPDVVSSDLRRGRAALRRRRGLRATSGLVLAGAALAVGVAVVPDLGERPGHTVIAPGGSTQPGVPLVPWDDSGTNLMFSPTMAPEGWTVSSTKTAGVISPPDVTTPPDDFAGKLVAMLVRHAPAPAADAQHLTVGTAEATIWREGDTTTLLLRYLDGGTLEVLAPRTLGWDTETLVSFTEALGVSDDAPVSRG